MQNDKYFVLSRWIFGKLFQIACIAILTKKIAFHDHFCDWKLYLVLTQDLSRTSPLMKIRSSFGGLLLYNEVFPDLPHGGLVLYDTYGIIPYMIQCMVHMEHVVFLHVVSPIVV